MMIKERNWVFLQIYIFMRKYCQRWSGFVPLDGAVHSTFDYSNQKIPGSNAGRAGKKTIKSLIDIVYHTGKNNFVIIIT